jgi:DNA-binding GntR family transcriptional regulator
VPKKKVSRAAGGRTPQVSAGRAATAVERIVDETRRRIKEGHFAPGQRLIEADLTRMLGVSRGSLREAMARLAGDGLVTIEPNRGAAVRVLTRHEVQSISAIREVLEGLAARLAAARIDDEENRPRFDKVWKEMSGEKARTNVNEYVACNTRFHSEIVRISANEPLAQLLEQLRTPVYRFQFRSRLTPESLQLGHQEHSEIAEAILAGDSDRAERSMRRHLRSSAKLIGSLPDDAFG